MAKRYKLSYVPIDKNKTRFRWRKLYKKHRYYFNTRDNETKQQSYQRCLEEWLSKKTLIDQQARGFSPEQQQLIDYYTDALLVVGKYYSEGYEHAGAITFALDLLKTPQDNLDDYKLKAVLDDRMLKGKIIAERRMIQELAEANTPRKITVKAATTLYLDSKKQKNRALSLTRISCLQYFLNEFTDVCKKSNRQNVDQIDEKIIMEYVSFVCDKHDRDETIVAKLVAIKPFIKFCWSNKYIDTMPRNIDSLKHKITQKPKPKHFTLKQIRRLYEAADDRMKLYILLGLNTGAGQKDVSTLHSDHLIDGVIDRPRGKTGVRQRHKLWPETARLLNEQRNKGKGPLLTRPDGKPLLIVRLDKNQLVKKSDTICIEFRTLTRDTRVKGTYYMFRKTAANILANEILTAEQKHLIDLYLSHTTKDMSRFYINQNLEALDEPLAEMGKLVMTALIG